MVWPYNNGRPYDDATDYPVVLRAAKEGGEISLAAVYRAFIAEGIDWPLLNPPPGTKTTPEADAVDAAIGRAWRELGWQS
jgi:hypothetical protein